MTNLLFLTNSYLKQFSAQAIAHVEGGVVLNQTAFYAGGGGQPSDNGELLVDGVIYPVKGVRKISGQVGHMIDGEMPAVGSTVIGQINWKRRYQLMRTHTAMHILCGVVWRDYEAQVTGGNMEPLKGRMDFEFENLKKELVAEIEAAVNVEVQAGRDVHVKILPREEAFQIPDLIRTKINLLPAQIQEVRTVELAGLDLQADGGTHVANTREVGKIRIPQYKSKGKINKRIYVELDE